MICYCKKAVGIAMCLVALAITGTVYAQQQPTFTLGQLTDAATHHLPAILQKQALVNSAKANVTDARHTALPALKLSDQVVIGTANGTTGTALPIGVTVSTSSGIRTDNLSNVASGNIATLYGEYELVNFGLRKARVQNALVNEQLRETDLSKDIYLLKLQVSKLYFSMLRNLYRLGIDQQNISRYKAVYNVIHAITKSGIRAGVDSSLALAELSRAQISYDRKMGEIKQLQQQMAFLTGITDSIRIDTSEKRYDVALSPAAWSTTADTIQNPLIGYFRKQKELYQATDNLIKKSYLPKILLAGGIWGRGTSIDYADNYNYKALSNGLGYQRFNYAAGVALTYNLFDLVHRKDKLAVNNYNIQASNYGLEQQQQALNTALQQAQTAINTAELNLQSLPVQLQAATAAYDQKLAQYRAGIINLVDLTNASFVLYQAQTDYVEVLNDWMQANLDKAAATGNLDLFIQSIKN
jgi:outer membrane protein TolC